MDDKHIYCGGVTEINPFQTGNCYDIVLIVICSLTIEITFPGIIDNIVP